MMFKGLMGAGWLTGGDADRRTKAYVERSDFWSGASVAALDAAGDDLAPITDGLIAGTLVATETGWKRVEDLRTGDLVVTFDNGMQAVRSTSRARLTSRSVALPRAARPVLVPEGALGNRRAMVLLPGQAVLIESDRAEALYGDPFALLTAESLDGHNGITRIQPEDEMDVILLEFDRDEVIYAEGTVLAHCPRRQAQMVTTPDELIAAGSPSAYALLPPAQGRAVLA
jgi:hypothetical protein